MHHCLIWDHIKSHNPEHQGNVTLENDPVKQELLCHCNAEAQIKFNPISYVENARFDTKIQVGRENKGRARFISYSIVVMEHGYNQLVC